MSIDPDTPLPTADAAVVARLERELTGLRAESDRAARDLKAACDEVAALRASETVLAEAFRSAPSFLCLLRGPDHVFELVNEQFHQVTGRRDCLGKSVAEAMPEMAEQGFVALLDGVYRTGVPFVGAEICVHLHRTPGGPAEERYTDFVYAPLRGPGGAVTGILAQGIDVTERRAAKLEVARVAAEAERERRLYQTVLSNTVDYNFVLDRDGRFTFADRTLLDLWGKADLAEVVGKTPHELGYPLDLADRLVAQARQVFATRAPLNDETPYDNGDGVGVRHYHYYLVPVVGSDGEVEAVAGSSRDVTERKQAEDILREGHQFFHSSIDALASNIAVLDETGVILAVNEAWRRFADDNRFGSPGYGVGRNYVEDFARGAAGDAETRRVAEGLADVFRRRAPLFEVEYPCHTPTAPRWFLMRVTRFKPPGPVRVVVSHENVTPRKLFELALADANRRKDEFLATLAHELRNPLAPIRNGLEVLKISGPGGPAAEATRGMMERQVGQLVRLVDDLLDISRINSGKLDLRRERVGLAGVLRDAVESSRPLIDRHGHELTVELPADPVPLDADPVRLAQAFVNLLNNAAKYSEPGGRIALTAAVEGGEVAVRVRDAGIGIAPGQLAGVFDMFAQVQTALEKSEGGLGIGLSLVKGLVAMHGGTVAVTSAGLGHGSEFVVRLPIAAAAAPIAAAAAAAPEPPRRGVGRRVLIVDDNVDSAESLGELLAFAGHEVRTAYDGAAGVAAAGAFRPEVVLLDLGMPKLNGYEAARLLRAEPWAAGVVLVAQTGWGTAEDRRKTRDAGFDHHLVKPVDPAAVMKLLAPTPAV